MSNTFADLIEQIIRAEASVSLTQYIKSGGRLHSTEDCKRTRKAGGPKNCVIHRPSLHRLTGSQQILRASGLIEDQCEHGIGHTNPDSAAFFNWLHGQQTYGVHGCDGCCGPVPESQKRSRFEDEDYDMAFK